MSVDPRHPTCPTCRYDLAGIVASWDDACPMTVTCPECGGEFETWKLLGRPRVVLPERGFTLPAWPVGCLFILAALTLLTIVALIARGR